MNTELPNPNRVLVIDDEQSIHKLIAARLRPEGIVVTGELDGVRGIARAITESIDLILLDVGLPNLDGFQVCRKLKEHPSTRNIPIIFLTSDSTMEAKIRGLDMGAVDYVTKPFEQAELRARVRAGLRTKRLQDILERQSFLDGLTGLWNRPYLDQRLESELNVAHRYGRPLGLMMTDIDHFKRVNDTWGHPAGDAVLRELALRIESQVRASDVAARYGGEEFVVILPNTEVADGFRLAERIRNAISATPIRLPNDDETTITASIGISGIRPPRDARDLKTLSDSLLARADVALYSVKSSGRDCVVAEKNA